MSLVAFGKNIVESLVNSVFFDFKKVIILEDKNHEYSKLVNDLYQKKITCEVLEKDSFSRHIPDKKHQGIIAFLKDYNYCSFSYLIKKKSNRKFPLIIMLDSIEDPHNFGAIIRTCAAMEVDGIIISSRQQVSVNNTVIKVSTGGVSYVPICRLSSLEEAINTLKINNYLIISTVCDEENMTNYTDFFSSSFESPLCVIFGNEHEGIKKKIIKKSNYLVTIPLKNKMNSLNVSVSFGIIISSIRR